MLDVGLYEDRYMHAQNTVRVTDIAYLYMHEYCSM